MLAYIKGTLVEILDDSVILDHHGMGYHIHTSGMDLGCLPPLGETLILYVHMNIREDDISLYGFLAKEALHLFKLLISVSGVGPKAGLAILSALSVNDVQMAIISGDAKSLTCANGIGNKSAQRIVIELKDKIDIDSMLHNSSSQAQDLTASQSDAVASAAMALTSLGYSQMEAMRALRQIDQADTMTEEALLKAALHKLV